MRRSIWIGLSVLTMLTPSMFVSGQAQQNRIYPTGRLALLWRIQASTICLAACGMKTASHASNEDPCQCSSAWQLSNPSQYSQEEPVGQHLHENRFCDRSLLIPQECGFVRRRIIGEWACGEGGRSQRCDNIPWAITGSDENYPICFPAQGLGPCTGVIHIFVEHQVTVKQTARCPDTGACRERLQIDLIPERYTISYIVPDCPCSPPFPTPVEPIVIIQP